jgi:hypothetical protein
MPRLRHPYQAWTVKSRVAVETLIQYTTGAAGLLYPSSPQHPSQPFAFTIPPCPPPTVNGNGSWPPSGFGSTLGVSQKGVHDASDGFVLVQDRTRVVCFASFLREATLLKQSSRFTTSDQVNRDSLLGEDRTARYSWAFGRIPRLSPFPGRSSNNLGYAALESLVESIGGL